MTNFMLNCWEAEAHACEGEYAHAYFHLLAAYDRLSRLDFPAEGMQRLVDAERIVRSLRHSN